MNVEILRKSTNGEILVSLSLGILYYIKSIPSLSAGVRYADYCRK